MKLITVFASENCIGWSELQETLDEFRNRTNLTIEVKDPIEHRKEFYAHGLVICPSIVYGEQLVAVGAPEPDALLEQIGESKSADNVNESHQKESTG